MRAAVNARLLKLGQLVGVRHRHGALGHRHRLNVAVGVQPGGERHSLPRMRFERPFPGNLRRAAGGPGVNNHRRPNIGGAGAVRGLERDAEQVLNLNDGRLKGEQGVAGDQELVAGAGASGELFLEVRPRCVRYGGGALPALGSHLGRSKLHPGYHNARNRAGFTLFVASGKPSGHLLYDGGVGAKESESATRVSVQIVPRKGCRCRGVSHALLCKGTSHVVQRFARGL